MKISSYPSLKERHSSQNGLQNTSFQESKLSPRRSFPASIQQRSSLIRLQQHHELDQNIYINSSSSLRKDSSSQHPLKPTSRTRTFSFQQQVSPLPNIQNEVLSLRSGSCCPHGLHHRRQPHRGQKLAASHCHNHNHGCSTCSHTCPCMSLFKASSLSPSSPVPSLFSRTPFSLHF